MTEELKRCPFCGEVEMLGYDDGMYQCVCRNCESAQGGFYDFPEEAAFAWNTRPIENELEAENARLREALGVILDEAQKDEPCILAIKVVAYTALKGDEK